jgi:hypothetical protein
MKPKTQENEENLPTVSKQTAGGITGAVIGGMLGGPVGAVAGGVAGALVGNSSAKGNKPIKKAVESIRSTLRGRKGTKAAENRKHSPSIPKKPKAKQGSAAKKAAAPLKKASSRKANRTTKRVRKKIK